VLKSADLLVIRHPYSNNDHKKGFANVYHRHLRKTDCLVCLVSTVSVYHKKQALVVGSKQSRQAVKADRVTRLPGLQGSQADKAVRLTRQSGCQGSQADKAVRLTRQSG